MQVFRTTVNIETGEVNQYSETAIEIEPGRFAVRGSLGNYLAVDSDTLHSGEKYVSSAWLPDLASAREAVSAELERRAAQLLNAAGKCSGRVASNV